MTTGKTFKYRGHVFRLCRTRESAAAGMTWYAMARRDGRPLPEPDCPQFSSVAGARSWGDLFPVDGVPATK